MHIASDISDYIPANLNDKKASKAIEKYFQPSRKKAQGLSHVVRFSLAGLLLAEALCVHYFGGMLFWEALMMFGLSFILLVFIGLTIPSLLEEMLENFKTVRLETFVNKGRVVQVPHRVHSAWNRAEQILNAKLDPNVEAQLLLQLIEEWAKLQFTHDNASTKSREIDEKALAILAEHKSL